VVRVGETKTSAKYENYRAVCEMGYERAQKTKNEEWKHIYCREQCSQSTSVALRDAPMREILAYIDRGQIGQFDRSTLRKTSNHRENSINIW
jgi:hypothetical protein